MPLPDAGVVVAQPMVALGEQRDGIHVAPLERLLKLALIEPLPHGANRLGGMEVEVDLAKTERHFWELKVES
jgi:hypothetical protein